MIFSCCSWADSQQAVSFATSWLSVAAGGMAGSNRAAKCRTLVAESASTKLVQLISETALVLGSAKHNLVSVGWRVLSAGSWLAGWLASSATDWTAQTLKQAWEAHAIVGQPRSP